MTRPGTEPRSPGPLANTLTTRPMSGKIWNRVVSTIIDSGIAVCMKL